MAIAPPNTTVHNVAAMVPHPGTGDPVFSRIPEALRVTLNNDARQRALHTAGCEIRFRMVGTAGATCRLRAVEVGGQHHGGGLAQVLYGDFSYTYVPIHPDQDTVIDLPLLEMDALVKASRGGSFDPHLVRIALPTHSAITGLTIEGDVAPPEPGDTPGTRMLAYGSSITQGSGSLTCRESWAGRCALLLQTDLINMGFGGGCHCEPDMTDYLVGRTDWDVAVLETGINMLGLDRDLADERITHLIRTFATAHPDKWIFCLGVFPCHNDIETQYRGRAQDLRELVMDTVDDIASPRLVFIDGVDALAPAFDLTVDLTHPSPAGMISIAESVSIRLSEIMNDASA